MAQRRVTVFGGSGFVGRYVVSRLAARGDRVLVATRRPQEALFLKPLGDVGQIQLIPANVRNEMSVARAVAGADCVINLIGILHESGKQKFRTVQAEGAENIAKAAKAAGVKSLIHVSAIGADLDSASKYARTKADGEHAIRSHFPAATILRPSIIFGPEDDFFNRFGTMASTFPALPLIAGKTRFQPVYVGDVADAVVRATEDKALAGELFELGGPKIYSFRELLDYILKETLQDKPLVPVSMGLAKLKAFFLQILPNPPLTPDQVKLLQSDNVVGDDARTFADLGVRPKPVEAIVPAYLRRFRPKGQFSEKPI